MKNSFFLVIPEQQSNPGQLKLFEEAALQQWILELPTANPGLATRLFFDLTKELTRLQMDAQKRLDALEMLRPSYLIIEDYLRSRLIKIGFPKGDDEQKILNILVAIEREFAIGYWTIAQQLTKRDVGWFQGKNAVLALQRVMQGLSGIVVSHYIMSLAVPDWVWIDLHSIYKLSIKLKKETTKVPDETASQNKTSTILDSYRQILLLSLANPTGLMQKEIQQVYRFAGKISSLVQLSKTKLEGQNDQCVVLIDEDQAPFWLASSKVETDSATLYMGFEKLIKALKNNDKFANKSEARFSSIFELKNDEERLPVELLDYLELRWSGVILQGAPFFSDRLDRLFSIGLNSAHDLQNSLHPKSIKDVEYLAESSSDKALSCKFEKQGVLSIGSMVSFRKTNLPANKRSLGVVNKVSISKNDGKVNFEIEPLAFQAHNVNFLSMGADKDAEPQKALIYGVKSEQGEKSFLIMESFMFKDDDVIQLFMKNESFPIVLRDKKNVGLGYWQFECRQVTEVEKANNPKQKGYDFI